MYAYRFVPGEDKLQRQELPIPVLGNDEGVLYGLFILSTRGADALCIWY